MSMRDEIEKLKLQLILTQIIMLIVGVSCLGMIWVLKGDIQRIEQQETLNFVRLQHEISDINTVVNYPGG